MGFRTVNRRDFIKLAGAVAHLASLRPAWAKSTANTIALTFDDPTTEGGANLSWEQINERILNTLTNRKLKAMLFVCGKRVDTDAGRKLVSAWDRAGHGIGNHSYSHLNFNSETVGLDSFESDALKNEPLIRGYPHFAPLFRFPFFKEGDTAEKRDGMRSFLRQHGYRIGRATVDTSDWAINARLETRVKSEASANLGPYRKFFLQHIWERTQFYDSLAMRVLGHPVRHTLLLHHNALNALFLDDVIAMFVKKGWKPVDAEWAYADGVYDRQPNVVPAGEGLIWALAKETGRFDKELRYPGEDDVYENPKMDALKL
jgi:peptidoglycan/xylan/chitin deacetylase (PgdA/CDA1 family)